MASARILPPPLVPKLDKLDWGILFQLDLDAFQSFSTLGKKLKTGRDVIYYRVKRLEELGIIKKYITNIDYSKLGYLIGALYLKFRHDNPELREEIITYYNSQDEIWWLDGMEGQYDLALGWFAKDISSLRETQRKLMEKYRKYFQDSKFRFFNRFFHYKRNYLSQNSEEYSYEKFIIDANPKLLTDEIDNKILKVLSENARMDYVSVAKKLKLTAAQVHYRIKQLKEKKIIFGARPLINLEKIGYQWYKLDIYLDDYTAYNKIMDYVSKHPNIIYAYDAFGGEDIGLDIEVKNYQEFKKLEGDIKSKFHEAIEKTDFIIFTKEYKLKYFPYLGKGGNAPSP
ncbi:MAG: Lrp/AsnC family transcriptional regulator [Candidatus ainarchaeum sp.]|nr:Lrp/AsnC family transcriptional regulator [Candidatus ainarchaeum sp.]